MKHCSSLFAASAICISALFLSACGTASTLTSKPNDSHYKSAYIQVERADATASISQENLNFFDQELKTELYFEENPFYKGDGLILSYKFITHKEGDKLKRFATFGTSDEAEATTVIETTFYAPRSKEICKIETHAFVTGGPLGGSIKEALEKAAREIAQYAKNTFK
jgi:hypothetical protein